MKPMLTDDNQSNRRSSASGSWVSRSSDASASENSRFNLANLAQRLDAYFQEEDDSPLSQKSFIPKVSDAMSVEEEEQRKLKWSFRQTVAYWISVSFIFGCILFTTGSYFWLISGSLSPSDSYTLVTVAFNVGNLACQIGSYASTICIVNAHLHKEVTGNPRTFNIILPPDRWDQGYLASVIYLIGGTLAKLPPIWDLFGKTPSWGSTTWIVVESMRIIGNFSYFVGGAMAMDLNQCFKWRPRKLAWSVSWLNGVGGLIFFVGGCFAVVPGDTVQKTLYPLSYLIGSLLYVVGSCGSLMMWKLNQFGYVYVPELNHYDKRDRFAEKKRTNVLYRDIAFVCFYNLTAALAVMAISFSIQCSTYIDWIKNQSLVLVGSLGLLVIGTVIHKEPLKSPYTKLLWLLRFYVLCLTVVTGIDTFHLSSGGCQTYGNHARYL